MTIQIYNTLSGKKEPFEPLEPGKVKMYVCGPTVYDSCHIGHARSVVVFDVISRYFRSQGYDVTYVRNFTDIDDKIIDRANQLGIDSKALAEKYIHEFYKDMDALNVERAIVEPKATAHIDPIIKIIETIIQKGFGYHVDGDVFFAVDSFEAYGKLSGRSLEEMEAGARVDIDNRKRNPFDFVLWKSAKPGEPSWPSPWGNGRPGWHIECSTMSSKYLGESLDIHGGGKDLIFPHHENEIAQSEAAFGKPFVRYWIHNGFVNIDKEKMSKSLGNFLLIKDVIKSYHPEAVRLFLLSNHYRSPIDFTEKSMEEATIGLDRIYALLERVQKKIDLTSETFGLEKGKHWELFCQSMNDDFNTARGIGIIFNTVHEINRLLDRYKNRFPTDIRAVLRSSYADLLKIGKVMGFLTETPESYFEEKRQRTLERESIDRVIIEKMIEERKVARKAKDWAKADQIRKELGEKNIILEDRLEGTIWKIDR